MAGTGNERWFVCFTPAVSSPLPVPPGFCPTYHRSSESTGSYANKRFVHVCQSRGPYIPLYSRYPLLTLEPIKISYMAWNALLIEGSRDEKLTFLQRAVGKTYAIHSAGVIYDVTVWSQYTPKSHHGCRRNRTHCFCHLTECGLPLDGHD